MGIAKQQFDKPTFGPIQFESKYSTQKSNFKFIDGKLSSGKIAEKVEEQMRKSTINTIIGGQEVNVKENEYLFGFFTQTRSIKQIFDFIDNRYRYYQSITNKSKKEKACDSFYLNFKKVLAPYYTEIYQDYKEEIQSQLESVGDEATRVQLESVLNQLERENGPDISEIENARFRKQITEGFLYGIPAIFCLVLIIKKLRS